jgi:uncharacterized protein YneF (UPF0154 family)
MKTNSKITRLALIIVSLLLFLILAGFNFSLQTTKLQTENPPTPTSTLIYVNGEPVLQSGETEGLILGAGIILCIILGGVLIQRLIQKQGSSSSQGNP